MADRKRILMRLVRINFPWVKRNPFWLAGTIWLFVFVLAFPVAFAGLIPPHHTWIVVAPLLFASGMALIFLLVSLAIRSLVHRLRAGSTPGNDPEYQADCLMVKNLIQMPGIVCIQNEKLILRPMLGWSVELPLAGLEWAAETRWFNGMMLFEPAKGFWLITPGFWRLGVAVQNADAFRFALEQHDVSVSSR